jgi:hypothetical protein
MGSRSAAIPGAGSLVGIGATLPGRPDGAWPSGATMIDWAMRATSQASVHATNGVVLVILGVLVWHRARDRSRVRAFVRSLAPLPRAPRDVVVHLTRACFALPKRRDDPAYLPLLAVIGSSPADVLAVGGCCSGLARLLIVTLAEIGIRASQVTLYHRAGHAQHCLVQAWPGGRPFLIDPTYGVMLRRAHGGSLGVAELRAGVRPDIEPLPGVVGAGYPRHAYYDFDYRLTQTANWTRSLPRRLLRRAPVASVGGRRTAQLEVPALLEWPQHLAALGAVAGLAAWHVLAYVLHGL